MRKQHGVEPNAGLKKKRCIVKETQNEKLKRSLEKTNEYICIDEITSIDEESHIIPEAMG